MGIMIVFQSLKKKIVGFGINLLFYEFNMFEKIFEDNINESVFDRSTDEYNWKYVTWLEESAELLLKNKNLNLSDIISLLNNYKSS